MNCRIDFLKLLATTTKSLDYAIKDTEVQLTMILARLTRIRSQRHGRPPQLPVLA